MIAVDKLAIMGDDLMVANVARVSFKKWHTEFLPSDARLLSYLAREGHWSPFAHPQVQFRITAPVFIARQLVKHQIGLVWNEVSRRYVDAEPEFYVPTEWRARASDKKQGSANAPADWQPRGPYQALCTKARELYEDMIEAGIAPEQARMVLPQAMQTQWIWTGSLYAFARVCRERLHPHAQAETREVAELIDTHMAAAFPVSWAALRVARHEEAGA